MINTNGGLEYRFVERGGAPKLEDGHLSGRAAPFNKETMIGKKPWGFREKIAQGAFAKSVKDGDVVLLDNHNSEKPLARQSAGTLALAETKGGLDWDAAPANTSYANDAVENARAGNYGGCSFGFEVVRDSWHYNKDDDVDERTLHEVKLHEISVCTFPAYADGTSVSARSQVDAAMEAKSAYYLREYGTWVEEGVSDDEIRANKAPYGDVAYADPGYQKDGKKRYPIDTKAHAKAAWSYINKASNQSPYSSKQLASIKSKIKAACKKFGVDISDDSQSDSAFDEIEDRDMNDNTTAATAVSTDLRRKLIGILANSGEQPEARVLQAMTALAEDVVSGTDAFDKAIRKAVKRALNKVGNDVQQDDDEDDPICKACNGSGNDASCDDLKCPGCMGTGRVVGSGDDDGDNDDAVGMNGTGGFDGGSNKGPNVPDTGHAGDGNNPAIGSGGPQVGEGTVDLSNPGPAPKNSEAGGTGGPQTYSDKNKTSGESRDGQPGTPTDPEGDADAARRMKLIAMRRRMQAETQE